MKQTHVACADEHCTGMAGIGAKPNLYYKAIELVWVGSPEVCVLITVESLAQRKVGALAAKTSLDQLFVQYKCTFMDKMVMLLHVRARG